MNCKKNLTNIPRQRLAPLLGAIMLFGLAILAQKSVAKTLAGSNAQNGDPTIYMPAVIKPPKNLCPTSSANRYGAGAAFQYDLDDPVRPAAKHADKNLDLRSYSPNSDPGLHRELIDYGSDDPNQPPQFATLFSPNRVPPLIAFYQVHNWNWAASPNPGSRGSPITSPSVTALGLLAAPGEKLTVPKSGYDIGGGMEVLLLFADEDTVALRYTREDSSAPAGYTVHIDNICTDPNLLALYRALDRPDGPRYDYVPPSKRPYAYDLPNLAAGQPIGTARSTQVVVAITDTGRFLDPHSCNEWWQIRPGYGNCR